MIYFFILTIYTPKRGLDLNLVKDKMQKNSSQVISKFFNSDATTQKNIEIVLKQLSKMTLSLDKASDHHVFQDSLSELTENILPENKEIFQNFLNLLDGTILSYPENNKGNSFQMPIDLSREIDFLETGYKGVSVTDIVDIKNLTSKDKKEVNEIEEICFSPDIESDYLLDCFETPGSIIVISRDNKT